MMKLQIPKVDMKLLPTIVIGAVIGLIAYSYITKQKILAASGRAANHYFSGEVNYYPGLEVIGPDAQTQNYLKTNVVPNMTDGFPPSILRHGVNAIFRENLETG